MNWSLCNYGNQQSPINIEAGALLFDPSLRRLHVDRHRISGHLMNKGQSVVFKADTTTPHSAVNITGGPLVYKYRFDELYVHFGAQDSTGSEHLINGRVFPGEIQLYAYNSDLYRNMADAQHGSNGIVGISVLLQMGDRGNDEFRLLSSGFDKIQYRGDHTLVHHLSLGTLLPQTPHYLTYEGSTTFPGCWETTTWILINKPIYITQSELKVLRQTYKGDKTLPKTFMANNFRETQPTNHRTVRTNIDFNNNRNNKCRPRTSYIARNWPDL